MASWPVGCPYAANIALAGLGILLGSIWLSPDLDMARTLPMRRWGPLRVLWWPYAGLFAHRGVSHHFLLGPLSRVAYASLAVVPVWWLGFDWAGAGWWLAWLGGGILLGNWLHLLAD